MRFLLFLLFSSKIIAILMGLKSVSKATLPYKLLLFQTSILLITESIGLYTGVIKGQNNMWLSNPYTLFEVWLVATIIKLRLSTYIKHTNWILLSLIPISGLWVHSIYTKGLHIFSNWFYAAASLLIILTSTILLFHLSNSGKKIYTSPDFWLATGLVISCSITIPLYGLFNYLAVHDLKLMYKLYYINQIAGIIRYSLIAVSFYIIAKPINTQPDVQH